MRRIRVSGSFKEDGAGPVVGGGPGNEFGSECCHILVILGDDREMMADLSAANWSLSMKEMSIRGGRGEGKSGAVAMGDDHGWTHGGHEGCAGGGSGEGAGNRDRSRGRESASGGGRAGHGDLGAECGERGRGRGGARTAAAARSAMAATRRPEAAKGRAQSAAVARDAAIRGAEARTAAVARSTAVSVWDAATRGRERGGHGP
ncbi:unnamed protein product [Closterium sp. Naga37s-1]|nr:unnamed protein product [Closterium sp. Naga37s-1]